MTEELRHSPEAGALHDQPRCERVSQVVPREVLDARALQGSTEGVLHVFHWFALVLPGDVGEDVGAVRHAVSVQALQRGQRRLVQRLAFSKNLVDFRLSHVRILQQKGPCDVAFLFSSNE